jgi:hypothetical protein
MKVSLYLTEIFVVSISPPVYLVLIDDLSVRLALRTPQENQERLADIVSLRFRSSAT